MPAWRVGSIDIVVRAGALPSSSSVCLSVLESAVGGELINPALVRPWSAAVGGGRRPVVTETSTSRSGWRGGLLCARGRSAARATVWSRVRSVGPKVIILVSCFPAGAEPWWWWWAVPSGWEGVGVGVGVGVEVGWSWVVVGSGSAGWVCRSTVLNGIHSVLGPSCSRCCCPPSGTTITASGKFSRHGPPCCIGSAATTSHSSASSYT